MSESVTIGGIGKNPAIEKINIIDGIDMENYVSKRIGEMIYKGEKPMEKNIQDLLPHFPVEKIEMDESYYEKVSLL